MVGEVIWAASGPVQTGRYASVQEREGEGPSRSKTPYTDVSRLSRRFIEPAQDIIVLGLGVALFALMVRTLWTLASDVFGEELDFGTVIAEVLFMLVMIELVRLLLVYLHEHHVAVDFMVELGIVSALREVALHGVLDLQWQQIAALSLFLVALGLLLRFGDLRPRYAEEIARSEDVNTQRNALPVTTTGDKQSS
jgi:uncharacterized membrane protein (DUF373 family)